MEEVVDRFRAKTGRLAIFENIEVYMKFYILAFSALFLSVFFGCGDASPKSVVVYFSQTGTTKKVAEEIRDNTGADLAELRMEKPYPSTYDSTIARVAVEREAGNWPKLLNAKMDLSKYDTVYIGYPIMFGTFAPPIYTFLDSNDLNGKTVVPFCTYGSGGMQAAAGELKRLSPGANVVEPYGIAHKRISKSANEVCEFVRNVRSGNPTDFAVGAFSENRSLTSDDSTVFAVATADYAYLHLVPKSVSSQIVAGTNYVFLCEMKGPDGVPSEARVLIFEPLPGEGSPEMIRVDRSL